VYPIHLLLPPNCVDRATMLHSQVTRPGRSHARFRPPTHSSSTTMGDFFVKGWLENHRLWPSFHGLIYGGKWTNRAFGGMEETFVGWTKEVKTASKTVQSDQKVYQWPLSTWKKTNTNSLSWSLFVSTVSYQPFGRMKIVIILPHKHSLSISYYDLATIYTQWTWFCKS
jgi:hypothetical protein